MKKKNLILPFCLALVFFDALALAHDFWAGVEKTESGQPIVAKIGFGHNFPEGEAINAEQLGTRFNPMRLLGQKGNLALKKGSEAKFFVSEHNMAKGTYLVLADTIPSYRSRTPEGMVAKQKNEAPGATTCSFSSSFGKAIVNLGGAAETALLSKPVGQALEIVPQVNPAGIKPGQKFPVQVLLKGKPLPGAELLAYFAGFSDDDAYAFSGTTNEEGLVNIIPLKSGEWLAKATFEKPYADPAVCDLERYNTTLTFTIAE